MNLTELYALADSDNIIIDEFPMLSRKAFSIMDLDGDCCVAIDPFQLESSQEERIVLAHELGHCETGSFYNRFAACDVRKRHENRADKWSFNHLVPKDELDEAVSAGFSEVWDLAELFDVPCEYMARAIHWYQHHNMDFTA